MLYISLVLEESAKRHPSKTAFICMGTFLTYLEANEAANKVANGLQAIGIEPGDKVALTCPNLSQLSILYFGILKAKPSRHTQH